jgi:glutathione synthase
MSALVDGNGDASKCIRESTKAFCGINGLMYTDGILNWYHAPVTLLPSSYPRNSFNFCQEIQPIINELVDKISRDRTFILEQLTSVGEADDFTKRLLDIYSSLPEDQIKNSTQFGILRSDYMLHNDNDTNDVYPLQVEINTIAASFFSLSTKVGHLHKHLLNHSGDKPIMKEYAQSVDIDINTALDNMPINNSLKGTASSLAYTHQLSKNNSAVILYVTQPGECNLGDQRILEMELFNEHNIKIEFMTLKDISTNSRLNSNGGLIIKPLGSSMDADTDASYADNTSNILSNDEKDVSLVYYRAGYSPDDYPTEIEWNSRIFIEKAYNVIKCPSVAYQLVGTKKIQQSLFEDKILNKFLSDENSNLLRKSFAAQYAMGPYDTLSIDGKQAMEQAISDGSNWVLKPQREGGGNNYYKNELSKFLKNNKNNNLLSGFILMQRIFPSQQNAIFFRKNKIEILPSLSELGIYGTFIGNSNHTDTILRNDTTGYLLRTKPDGVDEGGVANGSSSLNSVLLKD